MEQCFSGRIYTLNLKMLSRLINLNKKRKHGNVISVKASYAKNTYIFKRINN